MSVDVLGLGVSSEIPEARKQVSGRPRTGSVGAGGGGTTGLAVPLVLGPRPERVYSHALLLELKEHPLARQWPPYLDPAFKNARGVWDPDRWHLERKRGETPIGLEKKDGPDAGKEPIKREKEPKKERGGLGLGQDGEDLQQLVLSPQRRSFLSGCTSGGGEPEVNLRPEQPGAGAKRVGSGRLLSRPDRGEDERGFRRGDDFKRFNDNRRDDKFGSGFRGRERDEDIGWGDDRPRDGFYQHDARRDNRRNEDRRPQRRRNEPEWMSETISHNDIIELRGFDDKPSKKKENSAPPGNLPLSLALGINKNGQNASPPELPSAGISVEDLEKSPPQSKPQMKPDVNEKTSNNDQNQNIIKHVDNNKEKTNNLDILTDLGIAPKMNDENYNFDKIMESMLGAPPEASQDLTPKSVPKSRFSQFFNKGNGEEVHAHVQVKQDSRRSSIQDELLGNNILKEINGDAPQIKIPSPNEEERYFAPISPAAQTKANHNPLMEMIVKGNMAQQGQAPTGHPRVQDLEENLRRQLGVGGGQFPPHLGPFPPQPHPPQNVQDLFKSIQGQNSQSRQLQGHSQGQHQGLPLDNRRPPQPQDAENTSAFKKLVAMVGQNPEHHNQGLPFGPSVVRPSPIPAPVSLPSNAPTEQEILDQMMTSAPRAKLPPAPMPAPAPGFPQIPPGIANFLASHPLNLELVSRPEGKQLLLGLETGNITIENLVQQVTNPTLQPRQRDVFLAVLKLVTMQRQGNMPPFLGRGHGHPPAQAPGDLLPPGAGQTRVSPLMFPAVSAPAQGHLSISPVPQQARVPSPQEMTVLTQQIMQQALIKRKLEEQKENYRKRQGETNNPAFMVGPQASTNSSASPLAFTPTSVMRKSAAERKDSDPQIKPVPELKITSQKDVREEPTSPGRAITKGKEERPVSLEFGGQSGQGRRVSPHQGFPPQIPPNNPLMFLPNNPMGSVSHSVISQANAMAQHQIAASLMAQGIDPRQISNRLPGPAPGQGGPPVTMTRPTAPLSPNRALPPAPVPAGIPGLPPNLANLVSPPGGPGGQGPLARFFSAEVLAAAQSGAVPAMPPMPTMPSLQQQQQQKVLTLEEIETQAAAVRM